MVFEFMMEKVLIHSSVWDLTAQSFREILHSLKEYFLVSSSCKVLLHVVLNVEDKRVEDKRLGSSILMS